MRGALSRLGWTGGLPLLALVLLAVTWGRAVPDLVLLVVGAGVVAAVLTAVHHAEVVAERVGDPFGAIILAVAVTVIEVGLILTLMSGQAGGAPTLARDTVFAAVMITCNGIVGLSLLVASGKFEFSHFNPEGTGGALATVATLAGTCLVLPTFTLGAPGPEFTGPQLAFSAVASLGLWVLFILTQTRRHREFFLPVDADGQVLPDERHTLPSARRATVSLGLLTCCLIAVVGLAKVGSPAVERMVAGAGLPPAFVGVVIALLVLAPETLAAVRAAQRARVQTSLNLAYGSAMASIGLTIPTLAIAVFLTGQTLHLGLGPVELVLLAMTVVVGILTVVPGRATRLQAGVHLALFAAYLFLSASP